MPTGYTAGIASGETKTFSEYAMTCARAFGAFVHMRDDSLSCAMSRAKVSPHHSVAIAECKAEIVRLGKLTKTQWKTEADAEYALRTTEESDRAVRRAEREQRYRNMFNQVSAWTPPTGDHEGLKNFMLEQLESSINFDCGGCESPSRERQTGEQWYWSRISALSSSIAYHEKALREETERVDKANAWVDALSASLPPGA